MKPESKFIEIVPCRSLTLAMGFTKRWDVIAIKLRAKVGVIAWHAPWRRYCLFPIHGTTWDVLCLSTVTDFIEREMVKRKSEVRITKTAADSTDSGDEDSNEA